MSVEDIKKYEKMKAVGETMFASGFLFFLVVNMLIVGYLNSFPEVKYNYTEYMKYDDYIIPKISGRVLMGQGLFILAGALTWGLGQTGVMRHRADSSLRKQEEVGKKPTPQPAR